MKHLGRRCLGGILCAAALIVAPMACGTDAGKGITFAAYVNKVVAQKDLAAPSVERFLVRHLNDSSGLKRTSRWENVTFTRPGGFAFRDGITLDSIAFYYSGNDKDFDTNKVRQYVFRFKQDHCVFVTQLERSFGKFQGYGPIVDSGLVGVVQVHSRPRLDLAYDLVVTLPKHWSLVSPCVDSFTVTLNLRPVRTDPRAAKHELPLLDYSHPFPTPRKPQPTGP